ncbi:MAG: DUF4267 domain-containing protein [Hyphomicrobiaceae bacterium]|nr:DUF4267 domain-containing protein [Hyphomicrobiaceae bacterium]
MSAIPLPPAKAAGVFWLAILAGALLTLIGVRFFVVPEGAVRTFGLPPDAGTVRDGLEAVIGLRDIWLGLMLVALAWFAEWRAVALWFLLAVGVCWADAGIVAANGGPRLAVGFHLGSGVYCLVASLMAWRLCSRNP